MLVAYFDFCSNVPLNNTYKNAVHFTTNEERIAFFQNYIKISTGSNVQYNFNFKPNPNSLTTTLVINFEGLPYSKKTIYNINYILVHQNFDNETEPTEGYYFVTGVRCIRKDVVEFSLELDVMSTYPYGMAWEARNKVFVERKHCNRFRSAPYRGVYYFASVNGDYDSYVNSGDELDNVYEAQYPTQPIHFEPNKNPYDEDEQISENLTRSEVYELIDNYEWEMLITTEPINKTQLEMSWFTYFGNDFSANKFDLKKGKLTLESTKLFKNTTSCDSGVYVYIYPKYSTIQNYSTINILMRLPYEEVTTDAYPKKPILCGYYDESGNRYYATFLKEPKLTDIATIVSRFTIPSSIVYSLIGRYASKSTIPYRGGTGQKSDEIVFYFPSNYQTYALGTETFPSKNECILTSQETDYFVENWGDERFATNTEYQAQLFISYLDYGNEKLWEFINNEYRLYDDFTEEEIKDVNKLADLRLEPKLYKPPYSRYMIKSLLSTGDGFEINPLINEGNKLSIIGKFVPTPSLLRFSYFIKPMPTAGFDTPYSYLKEINVGMISTMNYTLPIKLDKYWETLAQQRNFAISGLVTPVASSLGVSSGILIGSHNIHKGKTSYASAMGSSLAGAAIGVGSAFTSAVNYIATVDNLKNAPDSVKNTGNDALSDFGLDVPLTPYIVKYELSPSEKLRVFNYYYMFGYKVSSLINFDECFNRQRFNYIQTQDDELYEKIEMLNNEGLSSEVRLKIQTILNSGITMWNTPYAVEMSLEYENTEI